MNEASLICTSFCRNISFNLMRGKCTPKQFLCPYPLLDYHLPEGIFFPLNITSTCHSALHLEVLKKWWWWQFKGLELHKNWVLQDFWELLWSCQLDKLWWLYSGVLAWSRRSSKFYSSRCKILLPTIKKKINHSLKLFPNQLDRISL